MPQRMPELHRLQRTHAMKSTGNRLKCLHMPLLGILFIAVSAVCGGQPPGDDAPSPLSEMDTTGVTATAPGVTPFIAFVYLDSKNIGEIKKINYVIEAKPNSFSKPVSITFGMRYLQRNQYYSPPSNSLKVPVFGLYQGYTNLVDVTLTFQDESRRKLPTISIPTETYYGGTSSIYFGNALQGVAGSNSLYSNPVIHVARSERDNLGYSFFYVKNYIGTPAIIDTDGNIRWLGPQPEFASGSSTWSRNGFVVGEIGSETARSAYTGPSITRYELDGRTSNSTISDPDYLYFTHNIDHGPEGLLGEFDKPSNPGSTIAEFNPETGAVLHEWDLAKIISDYMNANGDDASLFVRPGADWFHINATAYDPRDNSLIASSRENFLIKVNFSTKQIIWIFGDPKKYWYTFPSLRAKALTLNSGGLYPIGQHAVSITPQGYLQVFNDGLLSLNEPSGAAAGSWRGYSTVSTYAIDETNLTATDVAEFDYGKSIWSLICSSGYTEPDGSMLIDYSVAKVLTSAPTFPVLGRTSRLVGVNPQKQVAFDFEYPTINCTTSFSAEVIHFESLVFD